MESFYGIIGSSLSSISLIILKSVANALLSYPLNIAIIAIVSLFLMIKILKLIFRTNSIKKEARALRSELNQ